MTQYFVESKTKEPQLFCFSQILEDNFNEIQLVNTFQEDFVRIQQDNWLEYWNSKGEQLTLDTWKEKYKDYLTEETEIEKSNEQKNTETIENGLDSCIESDVKLDQFNEVKKTSNEPDVFESQAIEDSHLKSWNNLWEQHREEIYLEQYLVYTTIFYNYFLEFKNSLEQPLPLLEEDIEEQLEEICHQTIDDHYQLTEELEQLKLLGLPTSFGGRPQNSSKRSKRHNSKNLHFSDFFSESETESTCSDLEMEKECGTVLLPSHEEENSILHEIEDNAIAKSAKKAKRKNRKLKNVPSFIMEEKGLLKYWRKRFSLFSRFDEGIRLDRESWFSVTPEKVAKHLAERLACSVLVDGFCGSGGNAIQFALTCDKVIAIDIDPIKLEMAKHNASIYKVAHKIEFILGDFLQLASSAKLKADTVFLSPPWGGPKYKNKKDYDIEKYLLPVKASELVESARFVSDNVALFLPRNSNVKQIVRMAGVGKRCEIEHNYLDSRLVAITALYGEEILQTKSSEV